MKNIKKVVSIFLVLATMFTNVLFPSLVSYAIKTEQETGKLSNLVFLSRDLSNFIYTYDKDGISYKVVERADLALTNIESRIYKKNVSGKYELVSDIITNISDKEAVITIEEEGKIYTQKIDIWSISKEDPNTQESYLDFKNIQLNPSNTNDYTINSGDWTNYEYTRTYNGNEFFDKLTYLVVFGVISAIVAGKVKGDLGTSVVTAIDIIVTTIISESLGRAYYSKDYYYKHRIDNYNIRMKKTYTYFYEDRSRTTQIGDVIIREVLEDYGHI